MSNKHVLIMDEVDGMAGNEDRGGIQVNKHISVSVTQEFHVFKRLSNLLQKEPDPEVTLL